MPQTSHTDLPRREILQSIAWRAMLERDLLATVGGLIYDLMTRDKK